MKFSSFSLSFLVSMYLVISQPSNDECINAIQVAVPSTTSTSTINATRTNSGLPLCWMSNTAPDIWFTFVATTNAATISTCNQADYDTQLSLFEGSCGSLTCIAGNDDACGTQSEINTSCSLTVGNTYYILLHGYGYNDAEGNANLTVTGFTQIPCIPPTKYTATRCTFSFEDISANGTSGPTDDNQLLTVPIGFTFEFYEDSHTLVGFSSNGFLTFGIYNDSVPFDSNHFILPNTLDPNDFIAPLWHDLNPSADGETDYRTTGTAPNRQFIAQWTDVPEWKDEGANTFQAVLFETSNCIEFRYGVTNPEDSARDYTIGIENQDGTFGVQLDARNLQPGDGYRLCPPCDECQTLNIPDLIFECDGNALINVIPNPTCVLPTGETIPAIKQSSIIPGVCCNTLTIETTYECPTDVANNTITIQDTTPPEITCPTDILILQRDDTNPLSTGTAICTDICDSKPTAEYLDTGIEQCGNNITRDWTCTDDCGNESTCQQVITLLCTSYPTVDPTYDPTVDPPRDPTKDPTESSNDNSMDAHMKPAFQQVIQLKNKPVIQLKIQPVIQQVIQQNHASDDNSMDASHETEEELESEEKPQIKVKSIELQSEEKPQIKVKSKNYKVKKNHKSKISMPNSASSSGSAEDALKSVNRYDHGIEDETTIMEWNSYQMSIFYAMAIAIIVIIIILFLWYCVFKQNKQNHQYIYIYNRKEQLPHENEEIV